MLVTLNNEIYALRELKGGVPDDDIIEIIIAIYSPLVAVKFRVLNV